MPKGSKGPRPADVIEDDTEADNGKDKTAVELG
jgi:hypothetical protein